MDVRNEMVETEKFVAGIRRRTPVRFSSEGLLNAMFDS